MPVFDTPAPTFDDVWRMFQETDRKFAESKIEFDRRMAEDKVAGNDYT